MTFLTSPGKTYSIYSAAGCTVSVDGTVVVTVEPGKQIAFVAPDEEIVVSDAAAIVVEVTGIGADLTVAEAGSGAGFELTAEAIKAVVPIDWGGDGVNPLEATTKGGNNIAVGTTSHAQYNGTSVGAKAYSDYCSVALGTAARAVSNAVAIGYDSEGANNSYGGNIAIGSGAKAKFGYCISIGGGTISSKQQVVTIGSKFTETTDSGNVTHTCTTEGTGSITIGAGANTLNTKTTVDGVETTVESSNSVTIGCKALNQGADAVVIGAQASIESGSHVVIGARAKGTGAGNVAVGTGAKAKNLATAVGHTSNAEYAGTAYGYIAGAGVQGVAVGFTASATASATAIGQSSQAKAVNSIAIGRSAQAADIGAVVFRSAAEDGTVTQLYFSGANTPLANTYANGEAIMGYVTKDSAGNPIASGFKRLSALFDEGTMTQPAMLDENGEWVQPKVFHPSDLDLPVEEPTIPEPYTPLPVYPIVEPEIEELPSES